MNISKRVAWGLLLAAGCSSGPKPAAVATPVASTAPAVPPPASELSAAIPISEADPSWGERRALVTVVEFSDLQCPFCKQGQAVVAELQEHYGPSVLRVVWKNSPLPMHDAARPAAVAAYGAFALGGSKAFFAFIEKAFADQRALDSTHYTKWAAELGLDAAAFEKGLHEPSWGAKVDGDVALASRVRVNGTPTFFVNGTEITGAAPAELKAAIEHELERAKSLVAAGLAPDRVYLERTADNFKPGARQEAPEGAPDEKTIFHVPVGASPQTGPSNALVTVIEFSDFECPFCLRVEPTLSALLAKYEGQIRLVWKHRPLPMHDHAEPAAEFAEEARAEKGDKGFWAAHDALFKHQGDLSDASLLALAKELGLNVTAVKQSLAKHTHRDAIQEDETVADEFDVQGTPHFFVNGRVISGAQAPDTFSALIDAEIEHAKATLKGAPATDSLYEELVKGGESPPPPPHVEVPPSSTSPSRGDATAPVTVSIFADFHSSRSARGDATVAELAKKYGSRIRFVWHNIPLPRDASAHLAAEAALEAFAQKGNAGFWKFHDTLFAHQRDDGGLGRAALDGYAKAQGLDLKRWAKALDEHTHSPEIDADMKIATSINMEEVPSFVVNGSLLAGPQPLSRFARAIETTAPPGSPAKAPAGSADDHKSQGHK